MAFGTTGKAWPKAVIPYEIDEGDFPPGSANRAIIDDAISRWNTDTVMRLIPRNEEGDYVVFTDEGDNFDSYVGRIGGRQPIRCDFDQRGRGVGSVMHEIGHAVGLHHEHQRPDRDRHISVGGDDSTNCATKNDGRLLTDYNCGSIMHYGVGACGISLIEGGCRDGIGQRDGLSGRDVWGASLLHDVPITAVAAWQDDGDGNGVCNVRFTALSATGRRCAGPIRLNRHAAGNQLKPEAGMSGDGVMIFVWEDVRDGKSRIRMRAFNRHGRQHFREQTVNSRERGSRSFPHVAVAHDGRFVVVWQEDGNGNGLHQIRARGYKADGTEAFAERTVNAAARGNQAHPRAAIAPDGYFAVVYEDHGSGASDVRVRAFHADGTERWSDRRVSRRKKGVQRNPRVAMGPFGDFVVVWEDDQDKNGLFQIHMRGFRSDGSEKFRQMTANKDAAGQQIEPDVAVDDRSRPVVVWSDDRDSNGFWQIRLRAFDENGSPRFRERTVNTDSAGQQRTPRICMDAPGRVVVVWADDRAQAGSPQIICRGFHPIGQESEARRQEAFTSRQVTSAATGRRAAPCIAAPAMSGWDVFNPFLGGG